MSCCHQTFNGLAGGSRFTNYYNSAGTGGCCGRTQKPYGRSLTSQKFGGWASKNTFIGGRVTTDGTCITGKNQRDCSRCPQDSLWVGQQGGYCGGC